MHFWFVDAIIRDFYSVLWTRSLRKISSPRRENKSVSIYDQIKSVEFFSLFHSILFPLSRNWKLESNVEKIVRCTTQTFIWLKYHFETDDKKSLSWNRNIWDCWFISKRRIERIYARSVVQFEIDETRAEQ